MKNKNLNFKSFIMIVASVFLLSACSSSPDLQSSKEVIAKFKEGVKTIKSVDMTAALAMKGVDETDKIDFNLKATAKIDRHDDETPKAEVALSAGGVMSADDQQLKGDIELKVLTIGNEFYFNLSKIEANDPSFAQFKPIIQKYLNKWQRLPADFVPAEVKNLQEKTPEAKQKEEALKDLFVNTRLIEVSKEYGSEKVNGVDTYHYGITLNEDGLREYMQKAAEINESPMSETELDDAMEFIDSVKNIEMWIGQEGYLLYKGVVEFSGEDLSNGVESNVNITYNANSYNKKLNIEAPNDSQEFNPIGLLMEAQLGGGLGSPDEAMLDEAMSDEDVK